MPESSFSCYFIARIFSIVAWNRRKWELRKGKQAWKDGKKVRAYSPEFPFGNENTNEEEKDYDKEEKIMRNSSYMKGKKWKGENNVLLWYFPFDGDDLNDKRWLWCKMQRMESSELQKRNKGME